MCKRACVTKPLFPTSYSQVLDDLLYSSSILLLQTSLTIGPCSGDDAEHEQQFKENDKLLEAEMRERLLLTDTLRRGLTGLSDALRMTLVAKWPRSI